MKKKREATIKRRKIGTDPIKRLPYLVHPILRTHWIRNIILFLMIVGIGVGLYFMITNLTEDFENNEPKCNCGKLLSECTCNKQQSCGCQSLN
jgi:hypothetical protein